MTEKERIERFKSSQLVVNCQTKDEAEKFIDWCYENEIKWDGICKSRNIWCDKNTCYRVYEDNTLTHSSYIDYSNRGFEIMTYQEFFKEDEMNNLDYLIENKDKFEIIDGCYFCKVVYELKNKSGCINHCSGCEFNKSIDVLKYLAEKHSDKIKVTQFEYDVIDSLKKTYNGSCNFVVINKLPILTKMKEKGYFKNIDINMHFGELCENLEVEK